MRLSELLAALPAITARAGDADPEITLITADSRQAAPGALFVAARGGTVDGHRFIPEALARGAAAVVGEALPSPLPPGPSTFVQVPHSREALAWLAAAWHGFPARRLVMIGVTGTDGKTTTATLIHSILTAAGLKAGLISTVGAVIGDEVLDTGFHVTTPDAPDLQGYLARMAAAGFTHGVLEVTSHGLHQHRATACEFDVAVVTNITHEHLDYHKTYADYRAAKARLFQSLTTAARKPGVPKTGVLNADDSSFPYLASLRTEKTLSYSLKPGASFTAHDIRFEPDGVGFTAAGPGVEFPVTTPLVGAFNVSNCLAAIAATVGALGVPPEAARRGIAALTGVPGRMERIDLGQPFTAIVDFAHTPNALRRALETARAMMASAERSLNAPAKPARVIAVFGSAGLRDVEKRRLMAETSAELADLTVLTAEDPRTERLDDILEMMAFGARGKGGVEGETFFRVPDRGEALRLACRLARPGDIVLVCGKGHEQSMCFGVTEHAWDDRTALRAALAELLGVPGPEMPRLPTAAN